MSDTIYMQSLTRVDPSHLAFVRAQINILMTSSDDKYSPFFSHLKKLHAARCFLSFMTYDQHAVVNMLSALSLEKTFYFFQW